MKCLVTYVRERTERRRRRDNNWAGCVVCATRHTLFNSCCREKVMRILRIAAAMAFSLSALALGGCQTTTAGGSVGAQRKQLMLVSSQDLEQMAAQSYNKLKADASAKGTLNTDRALEQRVRAIAARIEPQTRVFRADAPAWKWEVNVITSNELNAYCMPGGKIMFYSGLLRQLNLSADEIAVVMGQELA